MVVQWWRPRRLRSRGVASIGNVQPDGGEEAGVRVTGLTGEFLRGDDSHVRSARTSRCGGCAKRDMIADRTK